jgi:uncharacterized protein YbjT (DUF2867 family)
MAKILLTGSTGFIGKRLAAKLLQEGHTLYAMYRIKGLPIDIQHPNLHIIYGDLRDPQSLESLPRDIQAAYYLVHSLGNVVSNLIEEEQKTAHHFVAALEKTEAKQIIFLSGIIEDPNHLSPHLQSRLAVEKTLNAGSIPCTTLRSSIVIGSGSASFEIIRDLTESLPGMIAPRWVKSYCQPIAVRDVLFYLNAVLLNEKCYGQTFDIGGDESITFREVLLRYAKFRHLKRFIIDVPLLTPKLSTYWLVFITSVRFSICSYLVESMKQNTRKLNKAIDTIIPHQCMSYEEALTEAFQKIAQNAVVSTWMDSWELSTVNADVTQFIQVPKEGCLRDIKILPMTVPVDEVKRRVWSIGGDRGWYSLNWAWRLRGLMDKMIGGTGFNRGRRHPTELAIGDSIDFWRVLRADAEKGHLILFAEMKVPGEAWLEFKIDDKTNTFTQTATFRPKGLFGKLYWYFFLPFHLIIFRNMARTLAQKMRVL